MAASQVKQTDLVMDNLLEIEALKEKLAECAGEAFTEETENKNLKRMEIQHVQQLMSLTAKLKGQEDEIRKLENSLDIAIQKNPNEDSTAIRDPEQINLDTIIARCHFILKDIQQAKKDGRPGNIDARICQIRKMFNDCLNHLKELDKNNQIVSKCLQALKDLDQSEALLRKMKSNRIRKF